MKLNEVKPIVEKYMNKVIRVYQDENEFEAVFNHLNSIVFQWDQNENITKVIIKTSTGDLVGDNETSFKYAIDLLETNSELLLRVRSGNNEQYSKRNGKSTFIIKW